MKVKDLDPNRTVYRASNKVAHLDRNCRALSNAGRISRDRAGSLWHDMKLCHYCTGGKPEPTKADLGMPRLLEESEPEDFGLGGWR